MSEAAQQGSEPLVSSGHGFSRAEGARKEIGFSR
jgi:hypothetical protein